MSEQPYMKLWIGDYLRDTRHLTVEQHGCYLLLLMAMWTSGGKLPSDHEKLARMVGLSISKWSKISHEVMEFFSRDSGSLTQKRLAAELKKAQKNSEVAKANSEARWLKYKEPPDAPAMQAVSYHSHSHKEERKNGASAPYAFVGKVMRLNQKDFDTWKQSFIFVDLLPYLVARDEFLVSLPEEDNRRRSWMVSTASDLRNKNADAREKKKPKTIGPQFKPEPEVSKPPPEEREAQVARLLKRTSRALQ